MNAQDTAGEAVLSGPGEPRRTAPAGLLVSGVAGLRQSIPAVIGLTFVMRDQASLLWVAIAVGLLVLAINVIIAALSWHRLTYHVGAEDIRVESGILSRAARSVPYERIQDVSLEQGPLARLLGLVEVRFETGAGGADDLALSYLTEDEGEELRNLVRRRRDGLAQVPGADTAGTEPSEMLFAMGPRRVLTFGMFEFSLAVVAVLFGVTQQLEYFLPFDIWDLDDWEERLAGPGAWLAAMGRTAQIVGALIALAALLAVGIGTGLIRTTLREWGFLLERTERGFRRRRGLLTRTDVLMPAHRVQAMQIGTGVLRRLFGWHGLSFVSLGQDEGSGSHVVAPFAKLREIWPIAREAGFEEPGAALDWHRASRQYRTDSLFLAATLPLLFVPVPLAFDRLWLALIPLGVAAFLAAERIVGWRTMHHALDARQIIARRGWLAPQLQIAPRVKLQSVEFRQGPLARRHGYGTLHLGLAGGTFAIPGIPVERAGELRRAVLASIAEADYSQLNRV